MWTLRPSRLLAQGESVRFTIRNIRLPYTVAGQPSFAPDHTTYLYLQYVNVPGFADGHYFLRIRKRAAEAHIDSFVPTGPSIIEPDDPVKLDWETIVAKRVRLRYTIDGVNHERTSDDADPARRIPRNASAYEPQPVPRGERTKYVLDGFGADDRAIPAKEVEIERWIPRIRSFGVTPTQPKAGAPIALTWETENPARCVLSDSLGWTQDVDVRSPPGGFPIVAPEQVMTYELVARRQSRTATQSLRVEVGSSFPKGCPLPPFSFDEAFKAVVGKTKDEWAANFAFPGAERLAGNYDPAACCALSVFLGGNMHGVWVKGPRRQVKTVSYLAVWGQVRPIRVQLNDRDYEGWTSGGWARRPESFRGYHWYRYPIDFWLPNHTTWALTMLDFGRGPQDQPFKVWAFRWDK
jgi:hypothetical protein